MPLSEDHPDYWTEVFQFTKTVHRNIYPALEPLSEHLRSIADRKVVLVTGAGSGFGKAACLQWAKAGAKAIVLAARGQSSIDGVAEAVKTISPSTQTLAIPTDVSSTADVDHLFEKTKSTFGSIDVVVHCAGVLGPLLTLKDSPIDEWTRAFDINFKGTLFVARALTRATGEAAATLVYAGTAVSFFAIPTQSCYTSSKAANNMIIDQIHAECPNLRVFNVHPGMAKSSVLREELNIYAKDSPELFGSLSIWLAGPQAEFLRGRFVNANWDVTELVTHQHAIVRDELLRGQPVKGQIGPGGHPF